MLDPRWVREHAEEVRRAAVRKRVDADVDGFLQEDRRHREVLQRLETLRAAQKAQARAMAALDSAARKEALAGLGRDKAELKRLEEEEQGLRRRVRALALRLPMPPAPEVPDGRDDGDNRELRRCGSPPRFPFPFRSHVEIGERLGILDIPRGVRLAGTRNYLLTGDGARLEQAVLRLAVDHMLERGFQLVSVPSLVQDACMEGTGYYPGGEEQAYRIPGEGLSLIGTAEVCLTSLHAGEVLQEDDLPLRLVALSPCFRREAGAAGRDTKGLYRVHQFWKVEQVVVAPRGRTGRGKNTSASWGTRPPFSTGWNFPIAWWTSARAISARGRSRNSTWRPGCRAARAMEKPTPPPGSTISRLGVSTCATGLQAAASPFSAIPSTTPWWPRRGS